ncbi:hypothetical protein NQ317_000846 [Molorchus minor]|uniref:Uncharacterized protein n=1 Tax=Molorchus minor TaxID=1323400 RepID=A0ABQ9IQY9_9CUCU|nr:hypothetical protein NQ317_000846 [Molorchus minor]
MKKINADKEEIRREVQEDIQNLVKDGFLEVQKHLDNNDTMLDNKLKEQDKKIQENLNKNRPSQIQYTFTPINTYQHNKDLYFYGDDKIHPKIFITRLKYHINRLSAECDIKQEIQSYLCGDTNLWYQMIENKFVNIEQFEQLFLKQYWNEYKQQKVRFNLFNEPKFSEIEMIRYLARHFTDDIRNTVITQRINTIEMFIDYLREIDDTQIGWRKTYQRYSNDNRNTYQRSIITMIRGGGVVGGVKLEFSISSLCPAYDPPIPISPVSELLL